MEFDIKNSLLKSYWKIGFQFWKVTFLGVSDQANCKFASIQAKYQNFSRYEIRERSIDIFYIGFVEFNVLVSLIPSHVTRH